MSRRPAAWTWWVGAFLFLMGLSVWAGPLKDPKRMVNDRTVDLSPLFEWWSKPTGERPLSAWIHLTGSVVGTNAWGWILETRLSGAGQKAAKSGGGNPTRVVLKNPPLQEFAKFEELLSRSKTLNQQRNALSAEANQAAGRAQELSGQQKVNRRAGVRSSSTLKQNTRHWREVERQAKDQLKGIDKQIKDVDQQLKAFPERDRYTVDCLALETGNSQNGLPLYDHGVPLR
jgi:hypothetical protein